MVAVTSWFLPKFNIFVDFLYQLKGFICILSLIFFLVMTAYRLLLNVILLLQK